MAKNFNTLLARMSPDRRARINQLSKSYRREMALQELREARKMTQVRVAKLLKVNQPAVSKIERQADMYISTLRTFVNVMGGQLRIEAVFPDGRVEIGQFKGASEKTNGKTKKAAKRPRDRQLTSAATV